MKTSVVRKAFDAFNICDYSLAIKHYQEAAVMLGEKFFRANIEICKSRIKVLQVVESSNLQRVQKENLPIKLFRSPIWQRTLIRSWQNIEVRATVQIINGSKKSALVLVRFLDEKENPINAQQVSLPISEIFGTNFIYLNDTSGIMQSLLNTKVPPNANYIDVGFCLFQPSQKTEVYVHNFLVTKLDQTTKQNPDRGGKICKLSTEFKVAMVVDEFTYNSFKNEFIAIPVEPNDWRVKFEQHNPDIFFCESAWSGPDPIRRPWKGKVYASKNFSWENRKELLEIISYCHVKKIPTIFWNKEDPAHYHDRINDFVKTAALFDYVFTSAAECVNRYKIDYGLKHVYALPFATNPKLFNPLEVKKRTKKITFAGSWYATHTARCLAMESILDNLVDQGFEIEIYDRYFNSDSSDRKWPERFKKYIKPNVPHEKMPEIYKSSLFGLNFNTVTESSTMFARRVFELMSCNTLVISNYSLGLKLMFDSLVIFADKEPHRLKNITNSEIEKIREKALNLVLAKHTYKHRWEQILVNIGVKFVNTEDSITVICLIRTREDALAGLEWFQKYSPLINGRNLLLIVDYAVNDINVAPIYEEFNRLGVLVTSVHHAKRYALKGRYTPVESQYFLMIDLSEPPPSDWIKSSIPHFQYMTTHLITMTINTNYRYSIGPYSGHGFILGQQHQAVNFITNNCTPHEVYYL